MDALFTKPKTIAKKFFKEGINLRHVRHTPSVNIDESDSAYVLKFAIPGFCREEIAISVKDNVMCISSLKERVKKECRNSNYEYDFSKWKRRFVLPPDADVIFAQAFYLNGELEIHIPKHSRPQPVEYLTIMVY